MTIALPVLPRDAILKPRRVKAASSPQRPAFGGPRNTLNRKGDHWAVDVSLSGLEKEYAAALFADLIGGDRERVSLPLPSTGSDAPLAADPKVAADGQAGSLLMVTGLPAGYAIRKGRFFSVITGGQRYVYLTLAATVASGIGQAQLAFWPMLRAAPALNDVVELIQPRIEGDAPDLAGFEASILPMLTLDNFTIEEKA